MNTTETQLGLPGGAPPAVLVWLDEELAAALVGRPYLFARPTYGDELTLHFGDTQPAASPRLAARRRGTHVLAVRGSAWLLRSGVQAVLVGYGVVPIVTEKPQPFNVTALESGALIGRGAVVAKASTFVVPALGAVGLALQLDDGSQFTVLPTPSSGVEPELPEPSDWELLTPTRLLRIGPGLEAVVEAVSPS